MELRENGRQFTYICIYLLGPKVVDLKGLFGTDLICII